MSDHLSGRGDGELVAVQVPRHLLTAVYAFIAEQDGRGEPPPGVRARAGGENTATSVGRDEVRVAGGDWTEEDFTRLLHDRRPSSARIHAVLDVLAATPDEGFSTTRLAEATGLTRGELSGGFSGFTRVCRSLRAGARLDWPIEWRFGASDRDGQGSETYYWLPAVLAERWTQVRGRR